MVVFPATTTTTNNNNDKNDNNNSFNNNDNTDNNDNGLACTAIERYKRIMNEEQIHTDDKKLINKIADLGSWGPGDFLWPLCCKVSASH